MMTAFATDRASEADLPPDRDAGEQRDKAPRGAVYNAGAAVLAAEAAMDGFTRNHRVFDEGDPDDTNAADQSDRGERASAVEGATPRDIPSRLPRAVGGPAVAAAGLDNERVDETADGRPAAHVDVDSPPPPVAPGGDSGMEGGGPDRPVPSPQDDGEEGERRHNVLPENFGPAAERRGGGRMRGASHNGFAGSDAVRDVTSAVMSERRVGWDNVAGEEIVGRRVNTEVTDHASGVSMTITLDLPYGSADSIAADLADYRATPSQTLARTVAERGVLALDEMLGREARPESRDVGSDRSIEVSVSPEVTADVRLVPAAEARRLASEVREAARKKGDHLVAVDEYTLRGALIAASTGGEYVHLTPAELHELTKVARGGFMHLLVDTDGKPPILSDEERSLRDRALSFLTSSDYRETVVQRYGVDGPTVKPADQAAAREQTTNSVVQAILRGREDFQNVATALVTGTFDPRAWQATHPRVRSPYALTESLGGSLPMNATTVQAREAAKEVLRASGRFTPAQLQIAVDLYGLDGETSVNETVATWRLRDREEVGVEEKYKQGYHHYHGQVNVVYRRLTQIIAGPGN